MTVDRMVLLLLAIVGGGVDAVMLAAFGVLTAAQTGNTILLGVALGRGQLDTGLAAGISVVGYVVGTGLGELLVEGRRARPGDGSLVSRALVAELLLLIGVLVAWWLFGASPSPGDRRVLVALTAGAMGIQSAVVLRLHAGATTTYVTGTLTTFTMGMIRWRRASDHEPPAPWISGVTLSVYAAAAVAAAFLWVRAREAALALPLVALAVAMLAAYLSSDEVPPPG